MTTTFTESDHPCATTGEFATKAQSSPETTLTGSSTAPILYTYTPRALVEHPVSIGELSSAAGTAAGAVDSFVLAARSTRERMIVSYLIGFNFLSPP